MYRFKYLILDTFLASSSFVISCFIVFPDFLSRENNEFYLNYIIYFTLISLSVNLLFKNYQSIYKFFSMADVISLLINILICNFSFYILVFIIDRLIFIPRSLVLINFFLHTSFFFTLRLIGYIKNNERPKKKFYTKNIILIGKLEQCNLYLKIKNFINKYNKEFVLGIITTNNNIAKGSLRGHSILGNVKNIKNIIPSVENKIDEVILLSDIDYDDIEFLYKSRTNKYNIIKRNISENYIREEKKINIEDLLGRKKRSIFNDSLNKNFNNKVVLVTGAAGSIGKEIVKQILNYKVKQIICLDNNEYNIFNLNQEIQEYDNCHKCVIKLCDIKNKDNVKKIINEHKPNIIFHAAAIKHVSLAEINPHFAFETNLIGTKNILDVLNQINNFENFILISTDKAVNPSSFMGLTKYLCERYLQNAKNLSKFNLSFVRFGNVLSSAGSVVPIFEKRIADKKDLLVTNEQVERFFMLPEEAVSLVLEAFKISKEQNLNFKAFLLNMGKPIKILMLAKKMLVLNNLVEGRDINIKITGLKPGEKLSEELYYPIEEPKILDNNDKDILHLKIIKNYENFEKDILHLIKNYNNLNNDELIKECYSIFKKQKL